MNLVYFIVNIMCDIQVLDVAMNIIQKYRENSECLAKGKALPVLSNQQMNAYLKEIADVCEIEKELTNHMTRHTFVTIVIQN